MAEMKKKGVRRRRTFSRDGNRGGRNQYAGLDAQQRGIRKAINSVPNGRDLDRMADKGLRFDMKTRLYLKPR